MKVFKFFPKSWEGNLLFLFLFLLSLNGLYAQTYTASCNWDNSGAGTQCLGSATVQTSANFSGGATYQWKVTFTLQKWNSASASYSSIATSPSYSVPGGTLSPSHSFSINSAGNLDFRIVASISYYTGTTWLSNGSAYYPPYAPQIASTNVVQSITSNFKVNGDNVSATTANNYCTSEPNLLLENTSTGTTSATSAQYRLFVYSSNASGVQGALAYNNGVALSSAYASVPWTNGSPASINLRNMPGTVNQQIIQTQKGYFLLKFEMKNQCNAAASIKTGLIQYTLPPVSDANFKVNNGQTGVPCNSTLNYANPCKTGAYSASLNLTSSTGLIEYYKIGWQEVTSAGVPITAPGSPYLSPAQTIPAGGVASLTGVSLNQFVVPGATGAGGTGYFIDKVGRYYKVQLIVGNYCGENLQEGAIKIDGYYRYANSSVEEEAVIIAYPNPVNNELHITGLASDETYKMRISDATGKVWKNLEIKDVSDLNINTETLPEGLYIYEIEGNIHQTGKFVKSH